MEIKFEYHQTRLDVYLNESLAIEGINLIGYEIKNKNNLSQLTEKTSLKIALTKPSEDIIIFELLEIDAYIVMRITKSSTVNITNVKIVTHQGNTETLLY
jgi:hypothetical protein